jgi:peptidoglycan/LPS O-acetylase OafA/YrhL
MEKLYLPGLNGIRAIAASIVVVFHVDQFAYLFGLKPLGFGSNGLASYAVDMFFALSGFLITYLLLKEKEKINDIQLSKFYIRRILRIWPLYYIAVACTLLFLSIGVISTNTNIPLSFSLYIMLIPNVAYAFGFDIISIFPLWSVGVEEQFYAFWPVLIKFSKNIFRNILIVIFGYFGVKLVCKFFFPEALSFISFWSFDSLGLGALFAYLVFTNHSLTKIIFHPIVQVLAWLFLFISIIYSPVSIFTFTNSTTHAFVYSILIANVSANPKTLITLEYRIMNFLGKISYGLYVYNMIIICLLSYFLKDFVSSISSPFLSYAFLYATGIGLTIIISYFSYYWIEIKFLKLKSRYSNIESTNTRDGRDTSVSTNKELLGLEV